MLAQADCGNAGAEPHLRVHALTNGGEQLKTGWHHKANLALSTGLCSITFVTGLRTDEKHAAII